MVRNILQQLKERPNLNLVISDWAFPRWLQYGADAFIEQIRIRRIKIWGGERFEAQIQTYKNVDEPMLASMQQFNIDPKREC